MQLRVGFRMSYWCAQDTPMMCTLNVHHSRANDLVVPDVVRTDPDVPIAGYHDAFGNWCTRLVAPAGTITITADGVVEDAGARDENGFGVPQVPIAELPSDALLFLLGSRYCETDELSGVAWDLFGSGPTGWDRVQAVCDYVHDRITFGYQSASRTRTARQAHDEQRGVCRDYAHLAVAFCRCLNIPARYCTGYLSDVGEPPPYAVMDFAAWFEAYLGGRWWTFDPRNNKPRIGRVLMARGRDATDVALANTFGLHTLTGFEVWCDEVNAEHASTQGGR